VRGLNLYELAFTCYVYNYFTSFNQTYKDLQKNTKDSVDLRQETHRKNLIVWLNKWGCRQFALDYHKEASGELLEWYKEGHEEKLPLSKNLWDLNDQELDQVGEIFDSLACKIASKLIRDEKLISKSFGSTGASKILFALRPNLAVPWDSYIRIGLGYSGNGSSYAEYLKRLIAEIEDLKQSCMVNGHKLNEVPKIIGREGSTVPQLAGEHFWVIETKKCYPPGRETLKKWAGWSEKSQ